MIPDLQQLSTTTRDLRKFGLVVGGVFSLLGGWFLFRHNSAGPYFLIQGVVLVLVGFVAPRALEVVYIALDESGLYYGSACLHSGPHALLLQLAHWTQGNRSCLWASCQQSWSGASSGAEKILAHTNRVFLLLLGAILVIGQGSALACPHLLAFFNLPTSDTRNLPKRQIRKLS